MGGTTPANATPVDAEDLKAKRKADCRVKKMLRKNKSSKPNEFKETIPGAYGYKTEMETEAQICRLCNRESPLYFYQQQDIIKRIPERSMTKLLLQMKADLTAKQEYLNFIRVSANWCSPCDCPGKKVHKYCQTAQIIIN